MLEPPICARQNAVFHLDAEVSDGCRERSNPRVPGVQMQNARSFYLKLPVVILVTLASALAPVAAEALPAPKSLSPTPAAGNAARVTVVKAPIVSLKALAIVSPQPTITSLSPAAAVAGGAAFTLTISGSSFNSTSIARWGATPLGITSYSATQLTASVPAALIATPGTASIMVTTSGVVSPAAAFTITPAAPAITSISPASAIAGQAFTMTVNGTHFAPQAAVNVGSVPLSTTYVSTTQLRASVPATSVPTAGKALVTVSTAGGTSAAAPLTVTQPMPSVTSLSPGSVVAGSQAFILAIHGANFLPGSGSTTVRWNYTVLATTYQSGSQLTAVVPAGLISGPGTVNISVATTAGNSSSLAFTITAAPPVITSVSPARITAGNGAFVLSVFGTQFSSTATVNWGSTPLATSQLGGSTLVAQVPASLVTTPGSANVTVTTAGGTSAPVSFGILQPLAQISSLNPASIAAGSAKFTLTINGASFATNSQARFGTTYLATTYISSTQLTATVTSNLIASAGAIGITIYTPGVGWSPSASFTVSAALPTITSLSPASLRAGGAGFMLTINGTAFTPASTCMWGASSVGVVYVSPTQLIAAVPASLIVNSGTGSVAVATQTGTSAPATFTINPAPPAISGLNPGVATAGRAVFTMTITGSYFTSASTAKWGSTALTTTFVSQSQLTAAVPAKLIAAAGSSTITVTTTAGASGPATFTVYPAPRIVTAPLPSGTAGSSYSGTITVAGGVPGYTWSVSGLPDSMSFSNTSGDTLTIAGRPAQPGTMSFQVSVQDSGGGAVGPVPYTVNIANGPNAANDGRLNGSYVCLLQGFIDDDGSRWASLASFEADGIGHFSSGVFDTNSQGIGSASGTITGSYNVGSDLNGLASLHTVLTDGAAGIETTQWALALSSATQPAQEFRMVEVDDLGQVPSGKQGMADCRMATPSAFSDSTISGASFVFALEGEDRGGDSRAAAGAFGASSGSVANGNIDLALGGSAAVQSAAFTGNYTSPDVNTGRFKIALKGAGKVSGLTVYIIDTNSMFILDNTSNDGEQAGNMRRQQQAAYSEASLGGNFVLYQRGAEFNNSTAQPSGYYAAVLEGSGDGAGSLTINQSYANDNGVYSEASAKGEPIALSLDSVHPGRAAYPSANGVTYLYFFDTGSALEMSVGDNGSLDSGWMESQTQTSFTNASLTGNYLFGEMPFFSNGSNDSLGELSLTAGGAINAALTTAGKSLFSWDQAASASYVWDATAPGAGTFLMTSGIESPSSCAAINAARFVCISQTDPAPSIQIAQQ